MVAVRQARREDARLQHILGDTVRHSGLRILAMCIGLLGLASVAMAHHGTANYDTSKQITVKGTVTGFEFVNPHVQIAWDAKDDSGTTQKWEGELTSPNRLSRVGWTKSSIKPGDTITISGYPTKSGAHEIWIQKVVLASGDELPTGMGN
jgi:uncharacterized protein DUF6152